MTPDVSVIFHTSQEETSHSRRCLLGATSLDMEESAIFVSNLLRIMEERGIKAATLSTMAGLNRRAVTDIAEGRVKSPKLSTVFALSRALGEDPGEMMGLGPRLTLRAELVEFLQRYNEDEQAQLLTALSALPR